MTNWCECDLFVYGETRDLVSSLVASDDRAFDFRRIIPMPSSLEASRGTPGYERDLAVGLSFFGLKHTEQVYQVPQRASHETLAAYRKGLRSKFPAEIDLARRALVAATETGHLTWYTWCLEHWNSKWNAQRSILLRQPNRLKYMFDSASNPPYPVIRALSERFPNLKFSLRYYERGQQFKGQYLVQYGGVLIDSRVHYSGKRGG